MKNAVTDINNQFKIQEKDTIAIPEVIFVFMIENGSFSGSGQVTAGNGYFG